MLIIKIINNKMKCNIRKGIINKMIIISYLMIFKNPNSNVIQKIQLIVINVQKKLPFANNKITNVINVM